MIRVLAVDPGEKVGWAIGHLGDNKLDVVDHGIEHLKPFALRLGKACTPGFGPGSIGCYDVVIYERWRLQAYAAQQLIGSDMQTSQLIGMIRFLAWVHSVKLVAQDPKDYKHGWQVAPPTVRAILDTLPKAHDESHDGPALGHLSHYWFKHFFDPTLDPS